MSKKSRGCIHIILLPITLPLAIIGFIILLPLRLLTSLLKKPYKAKRLRRQTGYKSLPKIPK